jgi:RNA polymerase sigma-70 factor (ECF subfamily)
MASLRSKQAGSTPSDAAQTNDVDAESVFRTELLALIPHLRAFSRSLCGDRALADDLAQDALARAWEARRTFQIGTNLKAWLFTILRNQFYSERRRTYRYAPWDDTLAQSLSGPSGEQQWAVELSDLMRAFARLQPEQREAVILIGVGGFTYDDAAHIANCPVGTMKSRACRGRRALTAMLEESEAIKCTRATSEDAISELMTELRSAVALQGQTDRISALS